MSGFDRKWTRPWFALVLFIGPIAGGAAFAEETAAERLLVLRNGGVLRGRIARQAERYVVAVEHGEIRVPDGDVELICADLEEAYAQLRRSAERVGVEGHLRLADWCLRQQLKDQAEGEITAARDLGAAEDRLALLVRRLELSRRPVLAQSKRSAEPQGSPAAVPQAVPPARRGQIEVIRQLPSDAVESFTSSIQPLLLNRCGATACHDPRGRTRFNLVRPAAARTQTRRFTVRNLQAALAQVDTDRPDNSPLVQKARQAHGGASRPPLDRLDAAPYRELVAWVQAVSGASDDSTGDDDHDIEHAFWQTTVVPGMTVIAHPASRAELRAASQGVAAGGAPADGTVPRTRATVEDAGDVPGADPFDPSAFNRFQATKRRPPEMLDPELSDDTLGSVGR